MKPGIKTSEFWLTLLAQVLAIVLGVSAQLPETPWMRVIAIMASAGTSVLSVLGYTVSRTILKKSIFP